MSSKFFNNNIIRELRDLSKPYKGDKSLIKQDEGTTKVSDPQIIISETFI